MEPWIPRRLEFEVTCSREGIDESPLDYFIDAVSTARRLSARIPYWRVFCEALVTDHASPHACGSGVRSRAKRAVAAVEEASL